MSARRPLLTALGATTLLAALWFVPSAGATAPGPTGSDSSASTTPSGSGSDSGSGSAAPGSANTAGAGSVTTLVSGSHDGSGDTAQSAGQVPLGLADTGGIDTTPYLLGGTLCLGLGAGFVTFSVRRSQAA
ncbi:hypothetical protein EDE04_2655 [Streptomyces sp. 2132.2]|uniref:hypothetical protein n=1 Tax=Streptomyces sp. 2132.2 TaxID=2485161 RepID=UPI000C3A6835|nr:hypothetical protein [Streptomyces sp. 2132.2]ROQ96196.1 hypothetical protein EDE04_2655 [Streptomyces sp. 2132.2]